MADDADADPDDGVHLRPVTEADLDLFERLNTPDAGRFGWQGFRDMVGLRRRLAEDGMLGPEGGRFVVTRRDEPLGYVVWRKLDAGLATYCWNIGISLLPEARGHGYGTTAQRLLVEYLFAHTPVERIEADTEVDNVAEQRALEKAGFTREGVLRRFGFRNGRYRDLALYSILRDEVTLED